MIVSMKKITLLVLDKYRQESLLDLRKLGVLHIKYINPPSSVDIDSLEKKTEEAEKAVSIISKYHLRDKQKETFPSLHLPPEALADCVHQLISLSTQKENYLRRKEDVQNELSWYGTWGEFSLNSLKELAKDGVSIRLYKCNKKELENLRTTMIVKVINKQADNYYIAVVSRTEQEDTNLHEVIPPDEELDKLKIELRTIEDKLSSLEELLKERAIYKKSLSDYLNYLKKLLELNKVKSGMQQEGEISYLEGFMPVGEVPRLVGLADRKGWAFLIQEPEDSQEVPILIKNPRWLRIIEPVFRFMGTLPGYNEYDISFIFLLFFSLFFALLIGDAGYGLVFLLVTYLVRKKTPNLPCELFFLVYVLGFATVVWGAISGTWFGFEKIAQLPFLKDMVIERINSFVDSNQSFMMYLCFFIGALHLTLAHSTIALRTINSLKALAQLGWILIIWSLFFVAAKLVLGRDAAGYVRVMFLSGITLVLLFSSPHKNVLKGIGLTLGDLPLKVVSSLADIISYLRLFAVGYASLAVAASFNDIVLRIGFGNIWAGFFSAMILFLGHGLNIVLGLLAVIVHGLRLNMLEFSSHLDMQWSGIEYKPFRE